MINTDLKPIGERMFLKSLILLFFYIPTLLFAEAKTLRVGGDFLVKEIKRLKTGDYEIVFEPQSKMKSFDRIVLNTDHVHAGVTEGGTLRLSAEVVKSSSGIANVSQMLIFYPSSQGHTPVWMISKTVKSKTRFNASKLIEAHSPQSDYTVF